jgi:hypothetical protein
MTQPSEQANSDRNPSVDIQASRYRRPKPKRCSLQNDCNHDAIPALILPPLVTTTSRKRTALSSAWRP